MVERKKGFTLVELLVVLAVIGVMLMLMGPTVRRMVILTQKDTCFSNVHHLSIAWVQYQADNNLCLVNGSTHGANPWACYGDERSSNVNRYLLITNGALFPYTHEVRYYLCPSDTMDHVRTYSIQSMMNGNDWGSLPYVYKYPNIIDPGATMVFCDEKDYRSNSNMGTFAQDPKCWNTNRFVDYVTNYHSGGDNYGFADGHAEWWKWEDPRTIDCAAKMQFYYPDNGNTDLTRLRKAMFNEMANSW